MATSRRKRKKTARSTASVPPSAPAAPSEPVEAPQTDSNAEFVEEYIYVRKDLRHLFLVSAVLFVVMLGIGLFI